MKRFCLFVALFSLGACQQAAGPAVPVKKTGAYQKPSCSGGPSAKELNRQKEDLFKVIEASANYRDGQTRSAALRQYKRQIAAKERSSCPEETELFMERIAELHKA